MVSVTGVPAVVPTIAAVGPAVPALGTCRRNSEGEQKGERGQKEQEFPHLYFSLLLLAVAAATDRDAAVTAAGLTSLGLKRGGSLLLAVAAAALLRLCLEREHPHFRRGVCLGAGCLATKHQERSQEDECQDFH